MAKYNKVQEPMRKAMDFDRIYETKKKGMESSLKVLEKQKIFNQSIDKELFQFGVELYEHKYTLDYVMIDIELCAAARDICSEDQIEQNRLKYEGIQHVPSYKKMIYIADNKNMFMSIENGYNVAKRRAYAKELDEKIGKSR